MNTPAKKTTADTQCFRVRISARRDDADYMLEAMSALEPPPGSWEDADSGKVWIETYGSDECKIRETAKIMADIARQIDGKTHKPDIAAVEYCDWAESWKRFHHVIRVSRRITVRPSWEKYEPSESDEIVVNIDPGMSFGTGLHPTTQSCLVFLDLLGKSVVGKSFLDIGCGSGILSIAAVKLGFETVNGCDRDPDAVRIAAENSRLNNADITFLTADITKNPNFRQADIVAANILSGVLIQSAGCICRAVAPGGRLILSGILENQYDGVAEAYAAHGMMEEKTIVSGEWKSGLFSQRDNR